MRSTLVVDPPVTDPLALTHSCNMPEEGGPTAAIGLVAQDCLAACVVVARSVVTARIGDADALAHAGGSSVVTPAVEPAAQGRHTAGQRIAVIASSIGSPGVGMTGLVPGRNGFANLTALWAARDGSRVPDRCDFRVRLDVRHKGGAVLGMPLIPDR